MIQSRWKSPVAWSAIAALIFFVVKTWIGFDIPGWDEFVSLAVAAGVAFGVFNNPEKKSGY
ncbi:MAG: holin [Clostridia bacterium]|jgi:hypothetical protein|nr:holin [Clostridia bacterium]